MAVIDEQAAWDILDRYANDCLEIGPGTLIALYAIGSLGGGYYRPGQSDIDAVLIVQDGSESVWGNSDVPSEQLAGLNRRYESEYGIPKGLGAFPLQRRELFPKYDPGADVLPLEIARLKVQGRAVYGQFDLDVVPLPTSEDFLVAAQRFEEWWRDDFAITTPPQAMSPAMCVNTILGHLSRFLMVKRDIIEFNKRKLVSAYLANDPPFEYPEAFHLVEASLASLTLTEAEQMTLRRCVAELRPKMNAYLGIAV